MRLSIAMILLDIKVWRTRQSHIEHPSFKVDILKRRKKKLSFCFFAIWSESVEFSYQSIVSFFTWINTDI